MKDIIPVLKLFGAYLVMSVGFLLMLLLISDYSSFQENTRFLQFKQDYINIPLWRIAFYIHVFSSILVLMAGFTQFSDYVLKNHRPLHRIIGRIYAWDILVINFPAGMILAFYANGGLPTKIAFVILDCLWFWFTYKAVIAARRKQIVLHQKFMIRSFALTFSAITLRTWKLVLSNSTDIDLHTLYMIDAWMGFIPNLLVAEWLIMRKFSGQVSTPNVLS